jgi:hypothetical protein
MDTNTYGGHTVAALREFIAHSNDTGESIDTLTGDDATSANIIGDLLTALTPSDAVGAPAWLAEWPANNNLPARWWHPQRGWCVDADKAIRFSRKEDADAYIETRQMGGTGVFASEHIWLPNAAPVAPAAVAPSDEHQATLYVECRQCDDCGHIGINDSHDTDAACGYSCGWTGPSPIEDKCPGCERENVMGAACPKCSGLYSLLAEAQLPARAAAPQDTAPGDDFEPTAWEATTPVYRKYITESTYQKFSPEARKWYRPYRCSACAAAPQAAATPPIILGLVPVPCALQWDRESNQYGWLFIPHADGQWVTAARLGDFSLHIIAHWRKSASTGASDAH